MKTLALQCLLLLLPIAAHAWGDEGHEIIALIAWNYLNPLVREKVTLLLSSDSSHLTADDGIAAEATWADRLRDADRSTDKAHYDATREWHYADIELGDPDIDAACFAHPQLPSGTYASAGPAHACIVDKIDEFRRELADPRLPQSERLVALQFLLHLIGDLHQPLHLGDDQDRGGNDKRVEALGIHAGTLHHYWDTVFVERLGEHSATVAQALIADISPEQRREWRGGTPAAWAMQSFELARKVAYGELPRPDAAGRYRLGETYVREATATVRLQLERAGVRLAQVLNEALQ
ncbi:MAG: S1/P1 nuclease [Steroidobacteraceae bacterium]